jgi:hypothetical protein
MRQRHDVAKFYRQALRGMSEKMDGTAPLPEPVVCPVTIDELLSEDAD